MEQKKSWKIITQIGVDIKKRWQKLADLHDLKIVHQGLPSLASFSIESKNAVAYKTLITQEMLAKGFLAGNSIYACTEHTPEVLNQYFEALDQIFKLINECENGRDIKKLLKGKVCHTGFKRLN